jgi:PhnB protein
MTSVKPIPEGYHTVTPYILARGADKLIDFIKKAFDAKETERYSMPDGTIGHAEVRIGDSLIMVADAQGGDYKPMTTGIHLYVEDCDVTYKHALLYSRRRQHLLVSLRINFMVIEVQV